MPISRSELEKGRTNDTMEEQVFSFLRSHSNQAYTAVEITAGLGRFQGGQKGEGLIIDMLRAWGAMATIHKALEVLVAEHRVTKTKVKQASGFLEDYFAAAT